MIQIETIKSFDNNRLALSFSAANNRIVLFGASGAGKSVLLKMIAGFFNPDRGKISVNSRILFDSENGIDIPIYQRRIGYLPQEYTLFPNLTVRSNILYGVKVQKKVLDKSWFDTLISRLEIGDLLERDPGSLSGGQQQRVALARSLIIRPDILLLDEPFSALDSAIRETLRNMVMDMVDELDIVTLLVTHDLDEAFVFGQHLVLVDQGAVVEAGERDGLYQHPRFVEAARLLGFTNIYPIKKIEDGQATIQSGDTFFCGGVFKGNRPYLCIRPEHIMILRENRPVDGKKRTNGIDGEIRHVYHHGRYIKILLSTGSGLEMQINIPVHVFDRLKLKPGMKLRVFLKEESIVVCNSRDDGVL
ncbi:MAG: ABC transporter ATP-binding protein [bacterium]